MFYFWWNVYILQNRREKPLVLRVVIATRVPWAHTWAVWGRAGGLARLLSFPPGSVLWTLPMSTTLLAICLIVLVERYEYFLCLLAACTTVISYCFTLHFLLPQQTGDISIATFLLSVTKKKAWVNQNLTTIQTIRKKSKLLSLDWKQALSDYLVGFQRLLGWRSFIKKYFVCIILLQHFLYHLKRLECKPG